MGNIYIKLKSHRGSFTIEAVLIFWVVFSVLLFSFGMMSWQFQKQAVASKLTKVLSVGDISGLNLKYTNNENVDVILMNPSPSEGKLETRLPLFATGGEYKATIHRKNEDSDIHVKLAWLSFLNRTIQKVIVEE